MPPKRNRDGTPDTPTSSNPTSKEFKSTFSVAPKFFIPTIGSAYPEHYRKHRNDRDELNKLYQQVVDEENCYRELFAQDRDNSLLKDPHAMLIPVHKNDDIYFYGSNPPEQEKFTLFPLGEKRKPAGLPCIVGAPEFRRNFEVFSEFQLRYLNWDNVFLAGGSTLACLQPIPEPHAKDNITRRNYFHHLAYKSSDIDLFIYGVDEEKAKEKVEEIFDSVIQSIPVEAVAFRSTHAITIVSAYPYRHIQIVLRLYKNPAEILMGFDVDSCSVGYDGRDVWMTPRAHRALVHQYNAIDMTRRSPSYEMRLAKYAERGFEIYFLGLNRYKIDPQLYEKRFDQLQGLAKLLLLEKLTTPEVRSKYKDLQRIRKLRPEGPPRNSIFEDMNLYDDEWNEERLREAGGADASDYSTIFLPWGPRWQAQKCRKMMYTKDLILNSKFYDPKKKHHTHPCFFGTVKEVMSDCCGCCPPVPPEELETHASMYVEGIARFITVNPGQQGALIGSFHPITEGDWTEGAYITKEAEMFVAVIG